jgi:hypothetical protein
MAQLKRDIRYINRDFSEFRQRLIEYTKTYFPNTYNDFSPASPGMLFMEQAAYVGDVLSFYLDNQFQENFVQYAQQTNNVYELSYMFGYKPKTTGVAQTTLDFYQQLPAKTVSGSIVPDYDYALFIKENTIVSSQNDISFLIQDPIDFSFSSSADPTSISVYSLSSGVPDRFLLKKSRNAISANIKTKSFVFTQPTPFQTIDISDDSIIGILDVVDSQGNTWYEVEHLGQEMVYKPVANTNINDPNNVSNVGQVPYLLRLEKIQRRFATRFTSQANLQIQFGAGTVNDNDEEITPNANNVGLGLPFIKDKLTTAFSPSNFLFTNTYGISPSNTTLTVRYLTGGGVNANAPANTINTITPGTANFSQTNLSPILSNDIFTSLSANNPEAASGGKGGDTLEEIRQNSLLSIASQRRAVTLDDYLVRALSMPSRYGSVSKVYIEQPKLTDQQVSTIETLNLYILSQNAAGQLDYATTALKQNLRTYLSQYRVIGDSIEIRDAYIINIGVNFEIIVLPEYNNSEVLLACITALQDYFNTSKWQLNQPIFMRDMYVLLDKIKGVQTVKNITVENKAGISLGYSQYAYDITAATQNQVIYPSLDPSIFEIKNLNSDIKGRVVPL